jgi:hypothetical protein
MDVIDRYFTCLVDTEVPSQYQEILAKYRKLALVYEYEGPIVWLMKTGFSLKKHGLKLGSFRMSLKYLEDFGFEEKKVKSSLVFWIPRCVQGSKGKSAEEQLKLLSETRRQYELPEQHCSGFGSVTLLHGLIIAHFKATGERVPLDRQWIQTDSYRTGMKPGVESFSLNVSPEDQKRTDPRRYSLGYHDEKGLGCWSDFDDKKYDYLGFFVLGVEELRRKTLQSLNQMIRARSE